VQTRAKGYPVQREIIALPAQQAFEEAPYLGDMGENEDDQDYAYDC
jgi:hypothetical protein